LPDCDSADEVRFSRRTRGAPVKTAWRVGVVVLVAAAAIVLVNAWLSDRAPRNYYEQGKRHAARQLELIGSLPLVLAESSGVAVSRTQPGVLWSHNDSGDGPNLYAIDASGKLLSTFQVTANARDWEDMSSGPCPGSLEAASPSHCLYLADIGDNQRVREALTIYVVAEPMAASDGAHSDALPARSFRYRYPHGPDDAEAIAVLPDGDMTIVTKGRAGTIGFFRLGRSAVARALVTGEVLLAEYEGDTGIKPDAEISRLVTGAAVSPDGETLAVRTYYEVYFFRAERERDMVRWRVPGTQCFLGKAEPQGEAIDFLDNQVLLLTSERSQNAAGMIHRLQC
jgi:hypothetical protein